MRVQERDTQPTKNGLAHSIESTTARQCSLANDTGGDTPRLRGQCRNAVNAAAENRAHWRWITSMQQSVFADGCAVSAT